MSPDQWDTLVTLLVINFPIVIGLVYANHRGWITLGAPYKPLIDLLMKLLSEATEDGRKKDERIGAFAAKIGALTDVVSKTLDLNEKLLDERSARAEDTGWDGTERRSSRGRQTSRSDRGGSSGGRRNP